MEFLDYGVFGLILLISLAIGVYNGFRGQKTSEEFLLGGRTMGVLPVTMSLFCSFISALTLIGLPVEVYYYGIQYASYVISLLPVTLALIYFYIPVFFELRLTSAYEYFEWRFDGRVRLVVSIIGALHLLLYLPTTIWGASLAVEQETGMSAKMSASLILLVCIAYSTIGGFKGVLWTDALQSGVIFLSLGAVVILGTHELGGISRVLKTAELGKRLTFGDFDLDPRTRYTTWTGVIGGYFIWMSIFAGTQAQIQRYNSIANVKLVYRALTLSVALSIICFLATIFMGLLIFTSYSKCNPLNSKQIKSIDQLMPFFITNVLGNYPGIQGLVLAGLTSGTLSTISSGLNSLAAMVTEDYVRKFYSSTSALSEKQLYQVSKIGSGVIGLVVFGLMLLIAIVNETFPILVFGYLVHGVLLAPVFGAFTLGMFFPWANSVGVLSGVFSSILLNGFIGVGSVLANMNGKLPNQRLPISGVAQAQACGNQTESAIPIVLTNWKEGAKETSFVIDLFSTSYLWQGAIGVISTVGVGLVVSYLNICMTKKHARPMVKPKLLSKPCLNFWTLVLGQQRICQWVQFSQDYLDPDVDLTKKKENYVDT